MKICAKLSCILLTFLFLINTITYAAEVEKISFEKDINIPIKYICESKGGTVTWDSKNKMAIVKYQNRTLKLKIGSDVVISNGKTKTLKSKATTAGGRTILPISVLNQELGLNLSNNDCLKIIGIKFIDLLKSNQVSEGSGLLSKTFSKYLNSKYITQLATFFSNIQFDDTELSLTKNTVHLNLNIPIVFQQINYNYIIRFDNEGKIDDLYTEAVKPLTFYSKPSYEDSNNFTEEEVTFGNGAWKLPATLTVPKGKGPFPVVVLVHGSGPSDRDESVGALKPFRDLAVGLASKNIAVLRYEKRTLEHSTKSILIGNFTMNEEFEQDAYAAAEYLKTVSVIDSSNIIVLGHSQGGYALPKILQDDSSGIFKAGIIMSGCTRPIYEVMQDQYEYFMNKGMVSKEQFEYIKGQVDILNNPSFDASKPPQGYTLGNAYYFNSMKTYDVIGDAKALNKPMLVLQGERDYQVSSKIDFKAWKEAFNGKPEVEFKLYPKLNHFYTEGEGDSLPKEYYVSANIPQYVIDDIAEFVNKGCR
jgi:uncharacterized protein